MASRLADPADHDSAAVSTDRADAAATQIQAARAIETAELLQRLSLAESRITNLQLALEREIAARAESPASQQAGTASAPVQTAARTRATGQATDGHQQQKKPPRKKSSPAPKPELQAELLAVDLWDGQPSIVVGTNAPGDKRSRVLAVGDTFNGITLQSVDVAAQRATFATGTGTVTLDMKKQGGRP